MFLLPTVSGSYRFDKAGSRSPTLFRRLMEVAIRKIALSPP